MALRRKARACERTGGALTRFGVASDRRRCGWRNRRGGRRKRSADHLFGFACKTGHAKQVRDRQKWLFLVEATANTALWWVEAGHAPPAEEAGARMKPLTAKGASPEAFKFNTPFDASGRPFRRQWPEKDCA
jgi:hypothetical protein